MDAFVDYVENRCNVSQGVVKGESATNRVRQPFSVLSNPQQTLALPLTFNMIFSLFSAAPDWGGLWFAEGCWRPSRVVLGVRDHLAGVQWCCCGLEIGLWFVLLLAVFFFKLYSSPPCCIE